MVRQNTQKCTDTGYINPSKNKNLNWKPNKNHCLATIHTTAVYLNFKHIQQTASNLYANYYATKKVAACVK